MDCPAMMKIVTTITWAAMWAGCNQAHTVEPVPLAEETEVTGKGVADDVTDGLSREMTPEVTTETAGSAVTADWLVDLISSWATTGTANEATAGNAVEPDALEESDVSDTAGNERVDGDDQADETLHAPTESEDGAAESTAAEADAPESGNESAPSPGTATQADTPWWRPPLHTTWDWQLTSPVDYELDVDAYDVDMASNTADTIHAIRTKGGMFEDEAERQRKIICYINVGAWESYREDAAEFPESVRGTAINGVPNESWLDIRQIETLAPIMTSRFAQAQAKGCDAIEPDNMDGYDETAHAPSGFPLTAEDQLRYNRWVAGEVHALGMAVGLKNDIAQAAALVDSFDFAVSEGCVQYQECEFFEPFTAAGKPVFLAEFELSTEQFCPQANERKLMGIRKRDAIDAYREACPSWL